MKLKESNKKVNPGKTSLQVQELLLSQIKEPEKSIREKIDSEDLKELANSIEEIGLIQPILVKPAKGGLYEIVAGHRRYLAHKLLKRKTIKCIVTDTDKVSGELIKLHENIYRENITPIEEAKWLKYMIEKLGLTQKQLADKIGKSNTYVNERLKLLELPKDLQKAVDDKKISISVALTLAKVDDEREMKRLLNYAIDSGASVQTVEMWVHDYELSRLDDEESKEALQQYYNAVHQDAKILFKCFACKGDFELNETIAVRLCNNCFQELNK
jgi:ParB family chromosome partitioning protein